MALEIFLKYIRSSNISAKIWLRIADVNGTVI